MPLEVQTLTYAALVSGQHLQWHESAGNGLRAIELSTVDENHFSDLISRFWTAVSLIHLGQLDAARPHVLVMRDLAERRSTLRLLASNHLMVVTTLSCLEGDWKAGRESNDRGLEMSPLNPQLLGTRVLLEHETGESAQSEVYLERLLQRTRQTEPDLRACMRTCMCITAIARITGVPDRLEIAEATADAVLSAKTAPLYTMGAKAAMSLLAVLKGDQSAAAEHYAYLLGQRGTMIWTLSSVDRVLGLLSHTMGNLDQAVSHFEDSLTFCRRGYRPELAWTFCDYADTLLQRNEPGHRQKAMSLLDESLAISSELGMRPLMERVLSRREILKA